MQRQTKARAKANMQAALNETQYLKTIRRDSQRIANWLSNTQTAIKYAFDDRSKIEHFVKASRGVWMSSPGSEEERQSEYVSGLIMAEECLVSMLNEIEHFWDDDNEDTVEQSTVHAQMPISPEDKEVFVVHGKNKEVLDSVKAFLNGLGLIPIILSEQPGKGRTIIKKFEDHARVKYAVALLTPDDRAFPNETGDEKELRARQNVIFEMGFFVGLLGRQRVAALLLGEIQIPSDYAGVEYIKLSESTWKRKLYQELHAAGFDVRAEDSELDACEGFAISEAAKKGAAIHSKLYDKTRGWDGIVHMVSEAYYRPDGQENFVATSILDQNASAVSYIQSLPQEDNPKDSFGNEFSGVQYYQVILDGVDPKVGANLKEGYENDESMCWRLVNEDKSVWETKRAVLSKTTIGEAAKLRVSFLVPEMELIMRDAI